MTDPSRADWLEQLVLSRATVHDYAPEPIPEVEPVAPELPSTGAAQPATSPSVSVSSASEPGAESQGGLPQEVIQRIVRQHMSRVRACYERGLSKNPELAGKAV